jgi:dihydroflavonol-4-reductase
MPLREVFDIAADAVGARRPRFSIPSRLLYIIGFARGIASRLLRRDIPINSVSVKLMHIMPPMDHRKTVRELGWHPSPAPDSIREAAHFYDEQREQRHQQRVRKSPERCR